MMIYRVSQKSVRILFLMYVKTKKDTVMNETVLESAYLGDFIDTIRVHKTLILINFKSHEVIVVISVLD